MNDDKFRLLNVPAPPAMPAEPPGSILLLRIGPRREHLPKAETEVLTEEKRRRIEQIDSKRNPELYDCNGR